MYLHPQIRLGDEKYWKIFGVLFANIRNVCKFATENKETQTLCTH